MGSVLDGAPFHGRLTTLKCLALVLGRHLVPFSRIPETGVNLQPVLFTLEPSPDLLAFRGVTNQSEFSRLFSAVLAFKMKLQVYKNCIWSNLNAGVMPSSASSGDASYTKLFYLCNFPDDKTYVGMNYRTVSIVPIAPTKLAYFALCAEGFEATKSVNQLVCIILEAVQVNFYFLSVYYLIHRQLMRQMSMFRSAAIIHKGFARFRT